MIDGWNKTGLINAKVDDGAAKDAFLKGKAAFWVTGPWNVGHAQDSRRSSSRSSRCRRSTASRCRSSACRASWSRSSRTTHGVESAAKDLVGSYMMSPSSQAALAAANGRYPANIDAGKAVKNPSLDAVRHRQRRRRADAEHPADGRASGRTSALRGSSRRRARGATRARVAFSTAARNIANKIG